jgi:tryptophanyl-tRNA synthetase
VSVEVLSCIQPTSEVHLGNYFGAIRSWIEMQENWRCAFGVVDLHAMTVPFVPTQLRTHTREMLVALLACGIDPERSMLFVQSLVPEHTELAWVLGSVCSYGELSRMTQFKDKRELVSENEGETFVSAGLFTYPVLMAADILVYRADRVPVGKDQEQHLELTRDIARRFNDRFQTSYFPEPKPLFTEVPKLMSLADPHKKMSKSLGPKHYIGLFEERASIEQKVFAAVTDSGATSEDMTPGVANLFTLLDATKSEAAAPLRHEHAKRVLKYRDLKAAVVDAVAGLTAELRTRRDEILAASVDVDEIARACSNRARLHARGTIKDVRELVGLPPMGL